MDTAHYRIELPDAPTDAGTLPLTKGCDATFVVNRIGMHDGQRFTVPFSPAADTVYLSIEVASTLTLVYAGGGDLSWRRVQPDIAMSQKPRS